MRNKNVIISADGRPCVMHENEITFEAKIFKQMDISNSDVEKS